MPLMPVAGSPPNSKASACPVWTPILTTSTQPGPGPMSKSNGATPDKAAAVIRNSGIMEGSFTFSFKPEMREGMRRAAPDMQHMITLSLARNVSVARTVFGADLIEIEPAECQPALIAAARASGLGIMGYYEGRDARVFERYFDAGLDYINHDHLDVALSVLEARS